MFFKFDTSGIQVLQDNEDAKSITANRYFGMGVPFNKLAEAFKLPIKDIPGGNIGYLPFSLSPAGQVNEPEPAAAAEPKPGKLLKHKLSESQKEIKWIGFIKIADKFEARVKLAVQKFFSHQELDVLARLDAQKSLRHKVKADDVLFDPDEEGKKLSGKMKPLYEQIIQKQAQQEIDNFNFSISFDLSNPRVADWIEKHGLDAALAINETTKEALRAALSEGLDAGESISDLAKRVADVYATAKDARAYLIARTETIAASNEGALETYRQTGLKIKKGWLSARDERTRDTHLEAGKEYDDSGAIPVDADFYVGTNGGHGAAPGQIGLPEEDCNCRCSVYPVIEE
jgi:predicted GNAT family acetyltransferase